jgi:hypothetical protein
MRRAFLAVVVVSALLALAGSAQAAKVVVRVDLSNGVRQTYVVSGNQLTGSGQATNGKASFGMTVAGGALQGYYLILQGVFTGERREAPLRAVRQPHERVRLLGHRDAKEDDRQRQGVRHRHALKARPGASSVRVRLPRR